MKISQSWLNDFVDCSDLTPEQFYELITTKVAEVDGVHHGDAPVLGAVAVLIKKVRPHPAREKLRVATVYDGRAEREVVCGAPNCNEGQLVASVAPGGRILPTSGGESLAVESRDVGGVRSEGVLVSEAELGLTADHSGLLVLSTDCKPGTALADLVGGPDTVIEIDNKSLTHRPDLWCHFGFARELAAILNRPLKNSADRFADDTPAGAKLLRALGNGTSKFSIRIDPASRCRRFTAVEFDNVSIQPSPLWLRRRLYAVGGGIRNLLVDLSNYVMHDIGQPNHAYDADLLSGTSISVRPAAADEIFLGLDGIERKLSPEDMVIADEQRAVGLAGILGGQLCSVNEGTKRLLLESANFDPVILRLTTKRQQIRTDASNRFEKSRSPYAAPLALHRFAELLLQLQPQARICSPVLDAFPEPPKKTLIAARLDYIRSRLGPEVEPQRIESILQSLGFGLKKISETAVEVSVPYERATRDITLEDDLVEEVGRIFGYENILEAAPAIQSVARGSNPVLAFENTVRDRLAGMGFSEAYNYSFMSEERARKLGYETASAVKLLNPIDATADLVRTTLVPGAIDLLERNARFTDQAFLFELGRAYETGEDGEKAENTAAAERRLLSISYWSNRKEEAAAGSQQPRLNGGATFYALASAVRKVLRLVSREDVLFLPAGQDAVGIENHGYGAAEGKGKSANFAEVKAWMHPYRAATIAVAGKAVGVIAELHPAAGFEIPGRAAVAELDIERMLGLHHGVEKFRQLSKYPDSFFEMSVVMPAERYYSELEALLRRHVDASLLRNIEVLDVYEGKPLKESEKSVSVRLAFGADDRTLSGAEISAVQEQLMDAVRKSPFALRG
jgi:phenylalanyl-tRNA synthetase beta chain